MNTSPANPAENSTEPKSNPPLTPWTVTIEKKHKTHPTYTHNGKEEFDRRAENEAARPADSPKNVLLDKITEELWKMGLRVKDAASFTAKIKGWMEETKLDDEFADISGNASDSDRAVAVITHFFSPVGQSSAQTNFADPLISDLLRAPSFKLATCRPAELGYTVDDVAQRLGIPRQAVRDCVERYNNAYGIPRPGATPPETCRRISQGKIDRNRAVGIIPKRRQRTGNPPGAPKKYDIEQVHRVLGTDDLLPGILKERLRGVGLKQRTAGRAMAAALAAGVVLKTAAGAYRRADAANQVPVQS